MGGACNAGKGKGNVSSRIGHDGARWWWVVCIVTTVILGYILSLWVTITCAGLCSVQMAAMLRKHTIVRFWWTDLVQGLK